MNLICFPNYTCGAILCDVLNKESSPKGPHYNISSDNHKLGKINGVNIYNGKDFDPEEFNLKISSLDKKALENVWIGSHCWPGLIDTTQFNKVICVSTENNKSKLYRYARIFFTSIAGRLPFQTKPEKPRNILKYHTPFEKVYKNNIINIEFEDWVEFSNGLPELLIEMVGPNFKDHIYSRRKFWMDINDFLYDEIKMNYINNEWAKNL